MAAIILSACRTPIGSFGGALKDLSAPQLGSIVIREAIARAGALGERIDDVLMGCVLQAGAGMNVARQAALGAGLPPAVPAETVNRVCGSGLAAVMHAADAIAAGTSDVVVAGGTESMSNAPYLLTGARWGYRMGNAEVVDVMVGEGLTCAIEGCHMGTTAEAVAAKYGISRAAQDAFAAESQRRAGAAQDAGWFGDEIVPITLPQKKGEPLVVSRDEYPRPGTTAEKLAALKPAFQKDGTVTAGNASGINDGAAALVVADERAAAATGRAPLGRIVAYATAGVEPMLMGLGPVPAVRKAVARAGVALADIDLFELNEAFAAVGIASMAELGISDDVTNVNGGAIALGHPIGMSGNRLVLTLLHELKRRGGGVGAAALCGGGGQGDALILETV